MSMSKVAGPAIIAAMSVERTPRIGPRQEAALPAILAPANSAAPPPDVPKVEQASAQIESYVRSSGRDLQFRVDDESGRVVVSVRDSETGELIRQIPNEEVLRIAKALEQRDTSNPTLLIDDKA